MPKMLTWEAVQAGDLPPSPRMRVNRAAPLALSTVWQRVAFTGASPLNVNTFPGEAPNRLVDWDAADWLFRFNAANDRNYSVQLFYHLTAGDVGGWVQLRLVVPAPTPVYFPFPDGRGCLDLAELAAGQDYGGLLDVGIHADQLTRAYGIGVEVRAAAEAAAYPTLADCVAVVYAR